MKSPAVIFVFVLILMGLVSTSYAETFMSGEVIKNSHLVESLVLEMSEMGQINVMGGDIKWMKINITVPQESINQQVTYNHDVVLDETGNYLASIYEENPPNIVKYLSTTDVKVSSLVTKIIPSSYSIPDDVKIYLEATENIQSDNAKIKSLSSSITFGSTSDFEKVAKLAIWVNEYITYDLAYSDVVLDAVSVLNTKKGVCAEYTTLFVALARSIDIPARYVSGFAHGDNGWEEHAYAEVYLSKWVPVDALWLEVGNLDATHIKYTVQLDNQVKNDVKVFGTGIGEISWETADKAINTKSISYLEPISDFEFGVSSTDVGPGDDIVFYAKIKQDDYRVLDLSLEPCLSDPQIITVDEKEKKVIIEVSDDEKIVSWVGHISKELKQNMIYTCPVTFNSKYLENRVIDITIESLDDYSVVLDASIDKPVISLGDEQKINVRATYGSGPGYVSVGMLSSDYFFEEIIDFNSGSIGGAYFSFTPERIGQNNVTVFTSTGEVSVLNFDVVEKGNVYLKGGEYKKTIPIGLVSDINFTIVNNKATDETLKLYYGDVIETVTVPKNSEMVVSSDLKTSVVGEKMDSFKITGQNIIDVLYAEYVVYDTPIVGYDFVYDYSLMQLGIIVDVSVDTVDVINVSVGEQRMTGDSFLGSKTFYFDVGEGEYDLNLVWTDMGGVSHSLSDMVNIGPENLIDKIIRIIKEYLANFEM